jgi:hypothetical protein
MIEEDRTDSGNQTPYGCLLFRDSTQFLKHKSQGLSQIPPFLDGYELSCMGVWITVVMFWLLWESSQ